LGALAPWASLTALTILLVGSFSLSQTLWAKVLTISGEVGIASSTPTPTATPEPETAQGCTPGFWKQEQHFAEWPEPYRPEVSLAVAFQLDPLEGDPTLLDGLRTGGGGQEALLRQAVAALLNAAHGSIDYAYSVDEALALVRAAFTTGEFEPVKDLLEAANDVECPLPESDTELAPAAEAATLEATPSPEATATEAAAPSLETDTPTSEAATESPTSEPATDTSTAEPPTETPEPPADTPTAEASPTPGE
jgi:hypothetical protein